MSWSALTYREEKSPGGGEPRERMTMVMIDQRDCERAGARLLRDLRGEQGTNRALEATSPALLFTCYPYAPPSLSSKSAKSAWFSAPDDGGGGGGLGGGGGSSVAAGFEILGRGEQERDATLKTNTFCTAPSLQDTRPGGTDGPSAASALGSAGDGGGAGGEDGGGDDGDDGDDGGGGSAYSAHTWATLSAPKASKTKKPRKRAKKKKAQTAPGGGEAGAEAQLASGRS